MSRAPSPQPSGNRLLDALPDGDRERIGRHLVTERVEVRQLIYRPGQRLDSVYFPLDSVVSLLTALKTGAVIEVASIGNDGMVGAHLFLGAAEMPAQELAQVQMPGEVARMDAEVFQAEVAARGFLHDLVQRSIQVLFSQVSQQVACNALHSVEQRCCRWILSIRDRVGADEFPITQEAVSRMLGVRRASVTVAAAALQRVGCIGYRRGRVTVLDGSGLERLSCECYGVIRAESRRLLGEPAAGPDGPPGG